MEFVAKRAVTASWREDRLISNTTSNIRREFGFLGSGAEVLHQSAGYNDKSPNKRYGFEDFIFSLETNEYKMESEKEKISAGGYRRGPSAEFPYRVAVKTEEEVSLSPTFCDHTALKSESLHIVANSQSSIVKNENSSSPGLPTDLESFQDLTVWCHRPAKFPEMAEQPATDELNTPIIGTIIFTNKVPRLTELIKYGEFMFLSPPTVYNINDDNLLDVPIQHGSVSDLCKYSVLDSQSSGNESTDKFINNKSEDYELYSNVYVNDNNGGGVVQEHFINNLADVCSSETFTNITAPNNATSNGTTLTVDSTNDTVAEIVLASAPANSSNYPVLDLMDIVHMQTAPNRNSLQLDFSNIWTQSKNVSVIDTPEAISTALELDKEEFNLINFINNEDLVVEEVASLPISLQDDQSQCTSISTDSTEDEDYEPPWKKRVTTKISSKSSRKIKRSSIDSEWSNETSLHDSVPKTTRRGRPPKRKVSVSSESNLEPESNRYRELRDKNNEASRKSRLNRKLKEHQMEIEEKELDVKNRKLKVRVEELEKLVNTMRSNFMQLLLKK